MIAQPNTIPRLDGAEILLGAKLASACWTASVSLAALLIIWCMAPLAAR